MYLQTLCNMWYVCWIMHDLGCLWIVYRDPSWYSTDYWVYMGSSMTVRPLTGCHCTCALRNWSVLRQLASEQDSTLIATCVFKTKVFVFPKPVLATDIYRCLNIKFESKVCQWSLSFIPVKDFRWLIKYKLGGFPFRHPYGVLLYGCHSLEW